MRGLRTKPTVRVQLKTNAAPAQGFQHMRRLLPILSLALFAACGAPKKCDSGSLDCACRDDGSCAQPGGEKGAVCNTANVCKSCALGDPGCAPKVQKCFSPCASDLTLADGTLAQCSV